MLRDHHQAAMIEGLLRIRHRRWRPSPEVWATRPVRGVSDLLLDAVAAAGDRNEPLIATEAQSERRRLEQQLRWTGATADALAQARDRPTSRLLLLRNTRATRAVVAEHAATIEAAYPARTADSFAALTTTLPWPGAALLWVDVSTDGPPSARRLPATSPSAADVSGWQPHP